MTRDWGGKPDKGSIDEKTLEINNKRRENRQIEIDEKPLNPVGTEEENWWLLRERYWREGRWWKTSWPRGSSRRKTDALWLRLTRSRIDVLMKVGWKSRAVTCSAAEDVECVRYPNSSKNTIKIKRSSVLFSSFVSAVGWSSLLSFGRPSRLDCRSGHRWCVVNSRRSRGRLVRMVLVEWADELSEVLDCWS